MMDTRVTAAVEHAVAAALVNAGVAPTATIMVALSGGPDSVALMHALTRLNHAAGGTRRLFAAHLNHRMRPREADRDEAFVRALCARLGVELTVEHAAGLAAGGNLEERARLCRHDFLIRSARRLGADFISLAHNRDDQAETVLMRLLRGGGAAGLAAIAPSGPGGIIRPLLDTPRARIIAYLTALDVGYVTDSTNLQPRFLRNRLRHELIPALERDYAPGLARRLAGLAAEFRGLDEFLHGAAMAELTRRMEPSGRLELAGFAALPGALANAVIRAWLRRAIGGLRRVNRYQIDLIRELCADGRTGSAVSLPCGWRMRVEYGGAALEHVAERASAPGFAIPIAWPGATVVPVSGMRLAARIVQNDVLNLPRAGRVRERQANCAWFDAQAIRDGLTVRNFVKGDRIAPLGMIGARKVQDVFVDRKTPRALRASWPVVVAEGEIVWIPGLIRSRYGLITPATGEVVEIEAHPAVGA